MWSYIFLKITINDGRGTHFQHKMKNKHVDIVIFVYVWQRRIPVGKFISINLLTIHFSSIPLVFGSLPLLWFLPQAYFLIYIFIKISLPLKIYTLYSLFRSFHVWLRRKSGSKYFKKMMVMSYPKQEVAAQKVKSDNRRLVSFLICIHMHIYLYI